MSAPSTRWRLVDGDVDLDRGTVNRSGGTEQLTTRELQLLRYLVEHEGTDVDRDALLRDVWGYEGRLPVTRAPDFAVRRLRGKIEPDPANPVLLLTVRNFGYRLVGPPGPPTPLAPRPAPPPVHDALSPPLPVEHDSFVGREMLLERLRASLDAGRVVTLLGTGGVGKTRVAIHHLATVDDPVAFCELQHADSIDQLYVAVARGLGVPAPLDPVEQIPRLLRSRGSLLVVLDGAQDLAEPVSSTVAGWLGSVPEARFLLTSRVRLRIPGELNLLVGPLPVREAAVLFRDRAQATGAKLSDGDLAKLEEVVGLLDCLPLAVELAAAKSRLFGLDALAARIHERFRRGAGTGPTTPLRAMLEESWARLDPAAQTALAQLSVFPGDFALDAAEAVVEVGDAWAIDLMETLLDHSLVRRLDNGRFALLATIRTFAAEQLDDAGAAEARHGRHYAGPGFPEVEGRYRQVVERDNQVVACRRAVARGDVGVAIRTLAWMTHLTSMQGPVAVLQELAEAVDGLPLSPAEHSFVDAARGVVALYWGDWASAVEHWLREYEGAKALPDPAKASDALSRLSNLRRLEGDLVEARRLAEQGLAEAVEAGMLPSEARALHALGTLAHAEGDLNKAKQLFHSAVARARDGAHPSIEAIARSALAMLWLFLGDPAQSLRELGRALELADRYGDVLLGTTCVTEQGQSHVAAGELDEAEARFNEGLKRSLRYAALAYEVRVRSNLARLYLTRGELDRAQDEADAVMSLLAGRPTVLARLVAMQVLAEVAQRHGNLDHAQATLRDALSLAREAKQAIATAELLLQSALLAAERGQHAQAAAFLEEAAPLTERWVTGFLATRFLAVRAEAAWRAGDAEAAQRWLAEGERTVLPNRHDAVTELARVRALLDG